MLATVVALFFLRRKIFGQDTPYSTNYGRGVQGLRVWIAYIPALKPLYSSSWHSAEIIKTQPVARALRMFAGA